MTRLKLLFLLCCACAAAAAGTGMHVCAAQLPSVSSGDALSVSGADLLPYTSYDTYYGSVSSTYLEYMRGYLSKLSPSEHYVGARVSQYDYLFAYGEDLAFNGSVFSGSVTVVRWNTDNKGAFSSRTDNSFSLDPGSYLVYTDLTDIYPSLATSGDFTLRQLLILLTMLCIGLTVHSMYQVRKIRRINRRDNS